MSWPSPEEFREVVQFPQLSIGDAQLAHGKVELDHFGLPRVSSGNFASVYRIHADETDYAFRCFLSPAPEREERYRALSNFILHDDLEYTLDFHYLEQGVRVQGKWLPAVKMEWVNGVELDTFINDHVGDAEVLNELASQFYTMMRKLHDAGIAHADLQHGNVIVTEQGLRLIDYDGMYVPDLKGLQANELGHRNYQHPERSDEHFGPYLDHFSAWLIYHSILAVARDPGLWRGLRDCLIFNHRDFLRPDRSLAFSIIEHHQDEATRKFGKTIRNFLEMEPSEVPPLHAHFELDKLPDLLSPSKLREELENDLEDDVLKAPPLIVSLKKSLKPAEQGEAQQKERLRVTSEVKYLGLSMGAHEIAVIMAARPKDAYGVSLERVGRDVLRKITHYRAADKTRMMSISDDFEWVPTFWLAYHEGQEVLVRVTGHIDPNKRLGFADWARRTMRGTWVTDGISRFHFDQDSGKVTYELAAFKPKARKWSSSALDWYIAHEEPPELWMRAYGAYQPQARCRWGAEARYFQYAHTVQSWNYGNTLTIRISEPQTFAGVAMSTVYKFVEPYPWGPHGSLLYQIKFDIPPGLRQTLRQNLVLHYGWPDVHDEWHDECATPWSADNTVMRWDKDELTITYMPLARYANDRTVDQRISEFFKNKGKRIAPPSAKPKRLT